MKRRQFFLAAWANVLFSQNHASSKGFGFDFSMVVPKERSEKREYDFNVPDVILWKSKMVESFTSRGTFRRTVGFIETASDTEKLLYLPGILVRQEILEKKNDGFLLYFKMSLNYLPLPRRELIGGKTRFIDRYEFEDDATFMPSVKIKQGLVKVDYTRMKLTERGKVYVPKKFLYRARTDSGEFESQDVTFKPIGDNMSYPSRDIPRSYFQIMETLYFEIDHVPLNFKLELPPLVINGIEVPLPVCYFEPYDINNKKWVG